MVAHYIEQFKLIISHLSSYSNTIHRFYFLTPFVEGLRRDIQAVVLVQRPPNLDTACALALLQEEVVEDAFGSLPRPPESSQLGGTPMPLPPPPVHSVPAAPAADRRGTDTVHADASKLENLWDYRARGLCFKCSKRWGHDHVCPTIVQLHVVEELLDIFGLDSYVDTQMSSEDGVSDTSMAISVSAVTGGVSAKAFQLRAWLQGHEVVMLIDSGSSNSFINEHLAS